MHLVSVEDNRHVVVAVDIDYTVVVGHIDFDHKDFVADSLVVVGS